jgi:clan AA aspartic protease (TIGR02281 family)
MPASQETQITFQLAGRKNPVIVIPVFISGSGPHSFVLDTGSGPTLISGELADALALARGEVEMGMGAGGEVKLTHSRLSSLRLGDATLESVPVAITDLSFIGRAKGARVDGTLGHSVLRHFALTLDYAGNTLTLTRPLGSAPAVQGGENAVTFRLAHPSHPLVVVPAFVNGEGPFDFVVDTGASSTVLSADLARKLGLSLEAIPDLTGAGGGARAWRAQLESLRIGAARHQALSAAVVDFLESFSQTLGVQLHGIVGYNFLRHFRVTFNYPAEILRLE